MSKTNERMIEKMNEDNQKIIKPAIKFWKSKFGEEPQTDADKLTVAMMAEYLEHYRAESPVINDALNEIESKFLKAAEKYHVGL